MQFDPRHRDALSGDGARPRLDVVDFAVDTMRITSTNELLVILVLRIRHESLDEPFDLTFVASKQMAETLAVMIVTALRSLH